MRDVLRNASLRTYLGAAVTVAAASALPTSPAHAQMSIAESRRAAGEAFDRGTTSMLANDFRAAAHFFEQAYHLAPAAVALKQAIRAHDRAGNAFRASNLALRLRDNYPNDEDGVALSTEILNRYGSQYVEVHATCTECAITANDALVAENITGTVRFFVQPNATVRVSAQFSTGVVTAETTGEAGSIVEVPAFEAPPPPPPVDEPPPRVGGGASGPAEPADDGGTPPALFYASLGLTAVAGGLTVWQGVNALQGVDAYEAAATSGAANAEDLYDAGKAKELRTNIGIGVTGGLAAVTVVFAVITDWDGDPEGTASTRRIQGLAATVAPTRGGASLVVGGRF